VKPHPRRGNAPIRVRPDRVVACWWYCRADGQVRGIDVYRARDGLVAEKSSYVKG